MFVNSSYFVFFFFQAEDGIRDYKVTGVQTCALPILPATPMGRRLHPAPETSLRRAAEILGAARRPVAVVGSSAMRLRNPDVLQSVIHRHRHPCASRAWSRRIIRSPS